MSCSRRLSWRENIPLVSYVLQKGRCRSCGARLSVQYPVVEALGGLMWLAVGLLLWGDWSYMALCCLLWPLLCAIAVIDWRTYTIPNGLNLAIAILGIARLVIDRGHWPRYIIGMASVSLLFLALWAVTGGRGLGFGDVKLMAAAGLFLGWQQILLALILGCVAGLVIHIPRMKRGAGRKLAFGPYLAAGIWVAALLGQRLIAAYLSLFGL